MFVYACVNLHAFAVGAAALSVESFMCFVNHIRYARRLCMCAYEASNSNGLPTDYFIEKKKGKSSIKQAAAAAAALATTTVTATVIAKAGSNST